MHMRTTLLSTGLLTLALVACSPTTTTNIATFDFEETGTLTRNAPGLSPGVWYVEYEEANNPALTMRLSFNEDSVCIQGETEGPCERSIFENDLNVTIRGMRMNDGIVVSEMEIE